MSAAGWGSALFDQHRDLLVGSGVTAEVARERGYVSADTKTSLKQRGFGAAQCNVPALVIPLHDAWGELAGYQSRPDYPRVKEGKPLKYETPIGSRMVLDVHPRVRPHLGDPTRPLLITEGSRKADSAVTAGLDCVALLGVWNWRGTNADGGKVALPDWEAVALNGRPVYIVFDSDVMTKPAVHGALGRLKAFLEARGADVAVIYLPAGEAGVKVGIDDFLAAGHGVDDLLALAAPELRPPPGEEQTEAEPVDAFDDVDDEPGHRVLDDLVNWLGAHVAFPHDTAGPAVALWAAHSWALPAAASSPRLAFMSPEPGSGKTRCLELLELTCRNGRHTMNMSAAVLYRTIETENPTLLVDEVDSIFGPRADKSHDDLRALVNAGHRPGATVGRMVGEGAGMEAKWFPVYCPVALAGLGDLPDTIRTRSIIIRMRRRAPGETVAPYRERTTRPEGERLGRRLGAWVTRHLNHIPEQPAIPAGVTDRAADCWEPLLAIADTAGGRWPELARRACTELAKGAGAGEGSIGVQLLTDIRAVFTATPDIDRLSSHDLAERLAAVEEAPWGDWKGKPIDARWLAHKLRPYAIRPHDIRTAGKVLKGYETGDFADAWRRYLPGDDTPDEGARTPHPPGSATSPTSQVRPVADADPRSATSDPRSATPNSSATPLSRDVADVADVADPDGGRGVRAPFDFTEREEVQL